MSMEGIVKDNAGFVIEVTVNQDGVEQDLSSYTTSEFRFVKPDGTVISRDVALKEGETGVLTYTAVEGDFDMAGQWSLRVYLANGSQAITSLPFLFSVSDVEDLPEEE